MKILELFAGIGGVAEAVYQAPDLGQIIQAVDIDQQAGSVYEANFGRAPRTATIESPSSWSGAIDHASADTWWLSPPCQPYCRRGHQAPDDPRRSALRQIIRVLATFDAVPQRIAMENVPEFLDSVDDIALRKSLDQRGYQTRQQILCPTQWGIPNRRRRLYLTAWRYESAPPPAVAIGGEPPTEHPNGVPLQPLKNYLDPEIAPELWVSESVVHPYRQALDIIERDDPNSVTACFTGGYGKSIKQAGSYLQQGERLRRFSPGEIQRLLGFRKAFQWPADVPLRRRWKLLGNSLSIPVVIAVLRSFGNHSGD